MKAKKENKVYTITTDQEKQRYLKEGFDIFDDDGNILEHSPIKKIEYGKYAALKKELEELKQNGEAKAADPMILEILREYASEHEINLGNASSISGIVKKIKEWKKNNPPDVNLKAGA